MTTPPAAVELLRWYVEMGVDEAIGVAPVDRLRPPTQAAPTVRNPAGAFRLFRIGDAVASRNIHAAIFDALRLAKDL